MENTIAGLLMAGDPAATALAWDGGDLSYGALRNTVDRMAGQLRGAGIEPGDRVAIILPNGPEAGISFLGVARASTAAPLNPSLRPAELESAIRDLEARAVLMLPDGPGLSLPDGVRRLALSGPAGDLCLETDGGTVPSLDSAAPAHDAVALVLQTSGTTARPKTVPLTHANLTASARNIAATLALAGGDRCLNVMPLFHIHGLVGALLSSLSAGASVVCTPGFDGFKFFGQMEAFRPTWYTAVPTIHQVVAERAARTPGVLENARLRFVRSSSAQLPLTVLESIEAATGAPMLEAYGMTEAAHQMCSNPLPPAARKPGSVGFGGAVEVTILAADGSHCASHQKGEVAVRGPNVFAGYHNNPEANATSFSNGWFRTGDEGFFDGDDYVFLTGRLKELINRGGEKVSPAEVEDVLLRHAAIAEAVVFARPHARLGEEVCAAVVLRTGQQAAEKEVRAHVSRHLAEFKVPREVHFVPALPKGPTGKLQRIGMAARLGISGAGTPGANS